MKRINGIYILLILIITPLVFIWFSSGNIIASGESAIPFYNSTALFESIQHTWTSSALGFSSYFTLAAIPVYFITSVLSSLFKANFLVQAIEFWILLFLSGLYTVKYTGVSFKEKIILFIASLFYIFNLFVIPNVWGRVQYPYIFFYTSLPMIFYCFITGINERKKIFFIILTLLYFLFSIAFASIPLLELLWIIEGTYLIYFSIINRKQKQKIIFAFFFFGISIIGWIVANSWWFLQFVKVLTATSYVSRNYTVTDDISTFLALSANLGNLSYVFRLMHKDFFNSMNLIWGQFYSSFLFIILSYLIPILTFIPLLLKKKPPIIYYFLGLSLLLIFLMKGSSGPFGIFFQFLFSHIRFFEAFRNSFEKFGLALPFAYAPLIGFSAYNLFVLVKKKYGLIIACTSLITTCILLFGLLTFPIWNRWIFTSNIPPLDNLKIGDYVKVPKYYQEANNWLDKDKDDFRNIALPMSGEGITYTWTYGYSGVELSNSLFNKPFISLDTSIQFLHPISQQIQYTFFKSPENFTKMMTLLGAKYLMVRSDIDYRYRQMTNPETVSTFISSSFNTLGQSLLFTKNFDKLSFYTNKDFIPKIFPTQSIYIASDSLMYSDIFTSTDFQNGDTVFDLVNNVDQNKFVLQKTRAILIAPETVINTSDYSMVSLKDAFAQIPYIHFIPGDKLYPLISLKEKMSSSFDKNTDSQFLNSILLSNKRLGEMQALLAKNKPNLLKLASQSYINSLFNLEKFINKNESTLENNKEYYRHAIFSQEVILNNFIQINQKDTSNVDLLMAREALISLEKATGIKSIYELKLDNVGNAPEIIYRFNVNSSGEYDILLKGEDLNGFYEPIDQNITIQLNNKVIATSPRKENGWINFGTYSLDKGVNEVQLIIPQSKNILEDQIDNKQVQILATDSANSQLANFKSFDPYSTYKISFDYWIEKGGPIDLQIKSDIDDVKDGKRIPEWSQSLSSDGYDDGWKSINYTFTPQKSSSFASFLINVLPYNNCKIINPDTFLEKSQCIKDRSFYDSYNKQTSFWYKNLKTTRIFTNSLMLRKTNADLSVPVLPIVNFTKINSSKYQVTVKNATSPFFLTFLESYHPLWQVTYNDTGRSIDEKNHFLVNHYANSWYIDRKGSYQLSITFTAEDSFILGEVISLTAISFSFLSLLLFFYKKLSK